VLILSSPRQSRDIGPFNVLKTTSSLYDARTLRQARVRTKHNPVHLTHSPHRYHIPFHRLPTSPPYKYSVPSPVNYYSQQPSLAQRDQLRQARNKREAMTSLRGLLTRQAT
jgi:hypothetical protein